MTTRVLLVDDHAIVRDGLKSWFEDRDEYAIVGEAADGRTAVELTGRLSPDVAIMDVAMKGLNGVEATTQIRGACEHVKIIALSMHAEERMIHRMMEAGARGYVLKECAIEELAEAIATVLSGRIYLSPLITEDGAEAYVEKLAARFATAGAGLTDRQREVLQLLAEGKTTKQIALVLDISVKTVETHRQHIMERLQIDSLPELTKFAVREGLTFLDS